MRGRSGHLAVDLPAGEFGLELRQVQQAQARLRTEASARALAKAGLPAPVRSGMGALKRALASHQGQWDRHRSQAVADLLLRAAADIAAVTDD